MIPLHHRSTLLVVISLLSTALCQFGPEIPPECDPIAAIQCEYEFLQCRLFSGPADDAPTMCACGEHFYGDCIRRAGCEMTREFDPLGNDEIYAKKCVDHIIKYDCPSTLMCSTNCASAGSVNRDTAKIIPFNNYGPYYLRLRFCDRIVHPQKKNRYATVQPVACHDISDFLICSRWVPPLTFVPVAIPSNTTYIEVDYCENDNAGNRFCHVTEPSPSRVYGNSLIFPRTFDVPQTSFSICETNGMCSI